MDAVRNALSAMESAQSHRGPDGTGMVTNQFHSTAVGIGQQRLSILDLTAAGDQPMVSPCGRYVLSYNGEVYNYKELAVQLGDDPVVAQSTGDTAVVLAALIRWGPEALRMFNGMWALALLDRREGTLLLSRDRLGVKPLYLYLGEKDLVAASEVKAVLAGGGSLGLRFNVNADAVGRFLFQALTSAESETFFRGIRAFPPGCYATVALGRGPLALNPVKFWAHPFENTEISRPLPAEELKGLLLDSVRLRMRADVPVGILLSGGLDSSSILAAAHAVSPGSRIQALSVISRDPSANEEHFIDRMVAHTGCEIIKVQSDDDPLTLWDEIDETVWHFDHPISSFSNVAHRKIMQVARDNGIIVLMTGQGADEQLGGYNKYFYFYLMDRLRRGKASHAVSMVLGCLRNGTILNEFRLAHAKRYLPFLRSSARNAWAGRALVGASPLPTGLGASYEEREWRDLANLSLPDLLDSEDKASMSWGCEMRTPFLDYRIVEALGRTPPEQKLASGWTKYILRKAVADLLPPDITWRRDKKGFTLPGHGWLTGPLRSRVEDVIYQPMLAADTGFIDPVGVRALYADFVAGRPGIRAEDILSIVSLEKWMRRFHGHITSAEAT